MDTQAHTDLGQSAEDFYKEQVANRTSAVRMAAELAAISSPVTFPPEDWTTGDALAVTNQSISSSLINTLASKLMLSAFPPGLPMAKISILEHKMQEHIDADPKLYAETLYALSRREALHRTRMESTNTRTAYTLTMKQQILAGNCLVLWTDINNPVVHTMHRYVVKRSAAGVPLVTVLEDSVSAAVADDDVVAACQHHRAQMKEDFKDDWEEEIAIYHVQKLVVHEDGEQEYLYWQEVEGGFVVPDTEAWAPFNAPAMYPAGLIPDYGSDWYIPFCLDYEGDMQAVENFAKAAQDIAIAASWNPIFVNPEGVTDIKDVEEADNLDTIVGRAEDLSSYENGKGGDYRVLEGEGEKAAQRLGKAFLATSSVQRSGERVTAFEWQKMTQELEEGLGGIYTMNGQTTQNWFVQRFIHMHQEEEDIAPMPKEWVSVGVITGLDSIGQLNDYSNLKETLTDGFNMLGPDAMAASLNTNDVLTRLLSYRSIKSDGMVKTPEQKQQETEAADAKAQNQMLMQETAGPIAKEGAAALGQMVQEVPPEQ